jgi:uncharacterized protein (DUF305 family)
MSLRKWLIPLFLMLSMVGCHRRDPHITVGSIGPYDEQFLVWLVHYHNDGDRMLGPCAQKESVRMELRDFCAALDHQHQERVERVAGWLKTWYDRDLPPADAYPLWLGSLDGPQFEQEFLKEYGRHHSDGITEMTECSERAQHPELKDLCTRVVPRQKEHVAKMKKWQCEWFKDCD